MMKDSDSGLGERYVALHDPGHLLRQDHEALLTYVGQIEHGTDPTMHFPADAAQAVMLQALVDRTSSPAPG